MKPFIRQYLLLILAGSIISIGIVISAISIIKDNPISGRNFIPVNAKTAVELVPGKYTIFYEYNQSTKQFGPLTITSNNKNVKLTDWLQISVKNHGNELSLKGDSSLSYSINQNVGESIISFKVDRQDQYEISINTKDFSDIDALRFTLIADFTERIFSVFKNFAIYMLISIPFVLPGFWIYIREEKKKSRSGF
ncbi:hypothetical protein [Paenibacillus roseipurpureus]|uniref:Uncharacterized protein n=1 Tax=Paenibacillus roseopurpureus TaxID=2918901 RepID=A0AA96LQL2_9BACL|nr:hypothetical protein [Paenibacillus sp. MBLB1832]WNR46200.1 hypothetical protein MJB10_08945 [Paenibacillus sp. MBLB1832]